MKKLLAFTLSAAMMLCPFTSYAAQTEEAKAVYQEMTAKSESLNDLHAFYDLKVALSGSVFDPYQDYISASDLTMRLEMDLKVKNANDLSLAQAYAYSRLSMLGESMDFSIYYEDGYLYMAMDDLKEKTAFPLDALQAGTTDNMYTSMMSSEMFMKDLTVRTEGENRILSYRMDDDALNKLLQAVINDSGVDLEGSTLTVRNVYGDYVVNAEGYYTHATVHMELDMTYQGENILFTIDGSIGVPAPGEAVEIARPDLSGYVESSSY